MSKLADYEKVIRCIKSCETQLQVVSTMNMVQNYAIKWLESNHDCDNDVYFVNITRRASKLIDKFNLGKFVLVFNKLLTIDGIPLKSKFYILLNYQKTLS